MLSVDYSYSFPVENVGGSGGSEDTIARQAISEHAGNEDIHVSADQKAAWNGKAEISDIPNTLPANGGNSDTVNGKRVEMSFYRSATSIGVNNADTANTIWKAIPDNSVFVIEAQALTDASWNFPANTSQYSLMIIKLSNNRLVGFYLYPKSGGSIYYATVDGNGNYAGDWKKVGEGCNAGTLNGRHSGRIATRKADGNYWDANAESQNDAFIQWDGKSYFVLKTVGGNLTMVDNAATLEAHPASDFVLKSEYDALAARVSALEGGT